MTEGVGSPMKCTLHIHYPNQCECSLRVARQENAQLRARVSDLHLANQEHAHEHGLALLKIQELKAELAEWKELHGAHARLVIPGETDSTDAYRKMYFVMKQELKAARSVIQKLKEELDGVKK